MILFCTESITGSRSKLTACFQRPSTERGIRGSTHVRGSHKHAVVLADCGVLCMQVEQQLQLFEMDEEPLPGFMPLPTPWHTAGSVAYAVEDGNGTLVFTGDGFAHKVFSIENPWPLFFADWMPETGPAGRYEFLDEAVRERWQLLCGHASFPGLLYVDHQGVNFQTTAAAYKGSADAMSVCT